MKLIASICITVVFLSPITYAFPAGEGHSGARPKPKDKSAVEHELAHNDPNDPDFSSTSPPILFFPVANRTDIQKNCSTLKWGLCSASDLLFPVCASNKVVYQNPGVLHCAQLCYPDIELEIFCDPTGLDTEELRHCTKCVQYIEKQKKAAEGGEAEQREDEEEEQPPEEEEDIAEDGFRRVVNEDEEEEEKPPVVVYAPPPPEEDVPPVEDNALEEE